MLSDVHRLVLFFVERFGVACVSSDLNWLMSVGISHLLPLLFYAVLLYLLNFFFPLDLC